MDVRAVQPDEISAVAEFIAAQQEVAELHVCYLSVDAPAIRRELSGLEPDGLAGVLVAREDAEIVGVLGAEWDTEPPRIWWHGPFAVPDRRWHDIADALYVSARELPPGEILQEELAPDSRNGHVAAFARRHGFACEEGSAVLGRPLTDVDGRPVGDGDLVNEPIDGVDVRRLSEVDRHEVAALHDRLFPATHTPGERLAEGDERDVLVAVGDAVLGYVAVELQENQEGYIDFLGVSPEARGIGVGRLLVRAACRLLRDERACRSVHLTVRASNASARGLYTSVGFTEERITIPWRRGFTVTPGG